MEENIKLVKEFSHDVDVLRMGIKTYQRKYIYPLALARTLLFLILLCFLAMKIVAGFFGEKMELLSYLLIVSCLALIINAWYKPIKLRESIVDSFKDGGNPPIYSLTVKENQLEIAMISDFVENVENSEISENTEDAIESHDSEDDRDLPEPSVLTIDDDLTIIEKDKLFLIVYGKSVYYIVPKKDFTSDELEIMRNIGKN